AVPRAFNEMLACYRWKSLQVRHRVLAWPVDHAVHVEHVLGRIDGSDAAMMALEMKARRREIAHGLVERREAPRRVFVRGGKTHARFGLELRARSIPAVGRDRAALLLRWIGRHVEMLG